VHIAADALIRRPVHARRMSRIRIGHTRAWPVGGRKHRARRILAPGGRAAGRDRETGARKGPDWLFDRLHTDPPNGWQAVDPERLPPCPLMISRSSRTSRGAIHASGSRLGGDVVDGGAGRGRRWVIRRRPSPVDGLRPKLPELRDATFSGPGAAGRASHEAAWPESRWPGGPRPSSRPSPLAVEASLARNARST
jgi:hypothetical protein